MSLPVLKAADFASDQDVRWCPGCGDYSILAQMKKVLPELGVPREKIVFISGIGCSSRFPYYMNTYGMHSIHGRAPDVCHRAEVDASRSDGLGDHRRRRFACRSVAIISSTALRRNLDINIVLFNNRIYGLTKGQYSPTSDVRSGDQKHADGLDRSSAQPAVGRLGSRSHVCRPEHRRARQTLGRNAQARRGSTRELRWSRSIRTATCSTMARWLTPKKRNNGPNNVIELEHGKPLVFGQRQTRAIRLVGNHLEVVNTADVPADDLLIHDEKDPNPSIQMMLARMRYPAMPEPIGCAASRRGCCDLRRPNQRPGRVGDRQKGRRRPGKALRHRGDTWDVA